MALKLRRGTSSTRTSFTPAEGELIYTTDTKLLYVGDGTTAGGTLVTGSGGGGGDITGITDNTTGPVMTLNDTSIDLDTVLNLGGDLDITNYQITGDGDISIAGDLTVSGAGTGVITATTVNTDNLTVTNGITTSTVRADIIGSVFAGDSSVLIDDEGNFYSDTLTTNNITSTDTFIAVDKIARVGNATRGDIKLQRTSTGDLDGSGGDRGRITFARNDSNGFVDEAFIAATQTLLYAGVPDSDGNFPLTNILSFDDQGRLGVGISATEKMHVNGNAIVTGTLTAGNIVSDAAGTPEISSASDIIITANSGAGNFEVDSAKLLIDDVDVKAKLDLNIEGVVMLGKEASNDPTAFIPAVVNAPILSSIANDDTLDGTDRVKEIFRYRIDRYSSGGEILLAINDFGADPGSDRFLVKKFLFHDNAGDGSAWTVTEIGTTGNAGLFTSLTVGLDNPGGGIDFFLTFTLRSPDAAISSASMIVTGQTTFTSNPLTITVSGY